MKLPTFAAEEGAAAAADSISSQADLQIWRAALGSFSLIALGTQNPPIQWDWMR